MYVTNNKSYDHLWINTHFLASTQYDAVMSTVQETSMQIMIDTNC